MERTYPGDITQVHGIRVGHAQNLAARTGATVVLCRKEGAVGGVSVRGAAPGTRETDLLRPGNLVEHVHAVVLAGGSAFGLDAAGGVMRYLEQMNIGLDMGEVRVPIVPAAVLFDLGTGDSRIRPDAAMGRTACMNAAKG
ncbi:MAG: P1 family peptidase, partial [Clostridiales bacterium]|nr:P1 family peptidase [Clostridiales bacterium]